MCGFNHIFSYPCVECNMRTTQGMYKEKSSAHGVQTEGEFTVICEHGLNYRLCIHVIQFNALIS